jgi:hypothetical protein
MATCGVGAAPSYGDITSIYFESQGTTAPIKLHLDQPVVAGDCPVRLTFLSTLAKVDMGASPVCVTRPSGRLKKCCGGETLYTDDAPQPIFARLLAVLEEDRFFAIPSAAQGNAPEPNDFGSLAYYKLAVMRCGAQHRDPRFSILFGGSPQAAPNTTIFSIAVPLNATPGPLYDKNIMRLFDDLTRAIYQSQWSSGDIY